MVTTIKRKRGANAIDGVTITSLKEDTPFCGYLDIKY
jgi:hypothetical protein